MEGKSTALYERFRLAGKHLDHPEWRLANVEPDPNLPGTTLAKVVMARGKLALHRVFYRPESSSAPDYLICQQTGFLRLFDTPPEKCFDFTASPKADAAVERVVRAHPVAKALPPHALPQFCQLLRDGLLYHLRSVPVGMQVDRWLAKEFPALAELQKASSPALGPKEKAGQTRSPPIYQGECNLHFPFNRYSRNRRILASWGGCWRMPRSSLAPIWPMRFVGNWTYATPKAIGNWPLP